MQTNGAREQEQKDTVPLEPNQITWLNHPAMQLGNILHFLWEELQSHKAKGRDVPVLIHRGQEELQTVIHSTIPGRGQLGVESHRGLMIC